MNYKAWLKHKLNFADPAQNPCIPEPFNMCYDLLISQIRSQRAGKPEVMGILRQEVKTASSGLPDNQNKNVLSLSEETSKVENTLAW